MDPVLLDDDPKWDTTKIETFECPQCHILSEYERNIFIIFNYERYYHCVHLCNLIKYGWKCPTNNCSHIHIITCPSQKLINVVQNFGKCLFNYKCCCQFENINVPETEITVPQKKVKFRYSYAIIDGPSKVYQTQCIHCKQLQYLGSKQIEQIKSLTSKIGIVERNNVYVEGLFWGYNCVNSVLYQ